MNLLMNKDGTPKGNKWSYDEDNRKKVSDTIKMYPKFQKSKKQIIQ